MMLTLHALGISSFDQLQWLDAPPQESLDAAERLLTQLHAIDSQGAITATGRAMIECPLAPRLARFVVEAKHRHVGAAASLAAALLSLGARLPSEIRHATSSDLFSLMEGFHPPMAKRLASSVRSALRIPVGDRHDDDALRLAVLAAFPDRVARRRQRDELLLSGGGSAVLAASSTVRDHQLFVAIDIEERKERGLPLVRLASAIEPEWLLDLFPERVTDRSAVEWHRTAERVESVSALLYDDLVIEESRGGRIDPQQAAELLGQKAREAGLPRFAGMEELEAFLARIEFASAHSSIPLLTQADAESALVEMCEGKRSFAELEAATRDGGLLRYLESKLNARLLDEIAPLRWKLPSGRTGRIEYAHGQPPRLAAKLQEFFGMKQTPRIANGKVPLVVLLLAPNQRPVQTTTDLAGFWERLYPELRRQLMRRYPKHSWPEI
jgi:ATP-dependent helicase HrpB